MQGERLSHAVGCAFAICLEKKQERDRLNVTMSFNKDDSTFTRFGSFRQGTITERLQVRQQAHSHESHVTSIVTLFLPLNLT